MRCEIYTFRDYASKRETFTLDRVMGSIMKFTCPNCGKNEVHEVVSMKNVKNGVEYLLRCTACGYTYKKFVRDEKVQDLKVIWSWRDKSEVKKISTFEDDIITVGDEIKVDGVNSVITAIDLKDGKRVKTARASDIKTIWAKRFDKVVVKISVNRGERTQSYEIIAHPDEEIYVGDIIEVGNIHAVVHKIKTEERFVTRGGALARDIVRVYAKEIREVGHY